MNSSFGEKNATRYRFCDQGDDVIPSLLKIIESIRCRDENADESSKQHQKEQVYDAEEEDDGSTSSDYAELDDRAAGRKRPVANHGYASQEKHQVLKVHEELRIINKKLQHESKRLKIWDLELQRKETDLNEIQKQLSKYASSLKETIEKETTKRFVGLEKEYESKLHLLADENKKTRNSFKDIKKANDKLKAKIVENESQLKRYEEKQTSFQSRISNLQRKNELLQKQINEQDVRYQSSITEKAKSDSKLTKDQNNTNIPNLFYENLSFLLQWIADTHLKQSVSGFLKSEQHLDPGLDGNTKLTNDRTLKIIMFVPHVLRQISSMNEKYQSSFVQFLYWSILHLNITQCPQRLTHSATLRRIGEVLLQVNPSKQNKAFYKSLNYNVRILSSLVILQSINQTDLLVQVFQSLNTELKSELSKEFFLEIHATEMLLPLFKLTNKVLLGYIADILMILIVDSPYMLEFLNDLSTVEWVQSIITVLKSSSTDITLMENLSLILQRISKSKGVKAIFDVLQIKSSVTEMLRLPSYGGEYLQLNLRSILLNIESIRTRKEK